jgi:hypothetical protein
MKARFALTFVLMMFGLGVAGYLVMQNILVPIPLSDGQALYVNAKPDSGEDTARLEALLPEGPKLEAFLATQSGLPLIEKAADGSWAGLLAAGLQGTRSERRWLVTVRTDWPMQDGSVLDAQKVATALGPEAQRLGGEVRILDPGTVEFRFKTRQEDLPDQLAQWRVPGTGPFIRQGHTLIRFDGFAFGPAGFAALTIVTDPAFLESHAWSQGLAARRWAWAAFPATVASGDMAKVRMAPYDELRLKDGTVWFLSRRLRRFRPNPGDWTRTRIFGAWKGSMDLPYDPLGM